MCKTVILQPFAELTVPETPPSYLVTISCSLQQIIPANEPTMFFPPWAKLLVSVAPSHSLVSCRTSPTRDCALFLGGNCTLYSAVETRVHGSEILTCLSYHILLRCVACALVAGMRLKFYANLVKTI